MIVRYDGEPLGELLMIEETKALTADELRQAISGDLRAVVRTKTGFTLIDTQSNDYSVARRHNAAFRRLIATIESAYLTGA
jgi:hypothetical protein